MATRGRWASWSRRDDAITEWLDAATLPPAALEHNLRDIRAINYLLGWRTFTVRAVVAWLRRQSTPSCSVLDIASGSADIPIAIARAAARAGLRVRVTATDRNPRIVAIARARAAGVPGVLVEQRDALALPYRAGEFDVALCTLALHHFAPREARVVLQAMARVARRVMVFDVVRSPLAYVGVIALTRLVPMDAMTRHDAPASVRRAYSAKEVRALASAAGLRGVATRVAFPYRLVLTAEGASNQARATPATAAEAPSATGRPRR